MEGPAGCGKSRLASWLGERAEEELGAVRIKAEYGPLPGAEDGILPSINRHWLLEEEQFEGRTAAERYTQIVDRLRFFCHFDRPEDSLRPVVLWLDNLQWGLDGIAFVQHLEPPRRGGSSGVGADDIPPGVLVNERVIRSLVDESDDSRGLLVSGGREPASGTSLHVDSRVAWTCVSRGGGRAPNRRHPSLHFQLVEDWVERGLLESSKEGFRLKEGRRQNCPTICIRYG